MGNRAHSFGGLPAGDDLMTYLQQTTGLGRQQALSARQKKRPSVWPLSAATVSSQLERASVAENRRTAGRGLAAVGQHVTVR